MIRILEKRVGLNSKETLEGTKYSFRRSRSRLDPLTPIQVKTAMENKNYVYIFLVSKKLLTECPGKAYEECWAVRVLTEKP